MNGAGATRQAQGGSDDVLGDFIAKNNNWAHVDVGPMPALVNGRTFSESVAAGKNANNPYGLPTFSREAAAGVPGNEQLQAIQGYSGVTASKAQQLFDSGYRVTSEGLRNMEGLENPEGRPTAFLPAALGAGSAAGAGGIVGGGSQAVRPQGAGAPPPFINPRTDMPTGTPGFAPADPSLAWGVSGKPIFELPPIDWSVLPLPIQLIKGVSDYLTLKITGGSDGDAASRLRDPKTGQFVSDPSNPPSPYSFTDADRRASWRSLAQDPTSPLSEAQRAEIRDRGWRGPQRVNEYGEIETMELSHEPVPLRSGGKEVVPRWPADHANVDPYRQLKKRP